MQRALPTILIALSVLLFMPGLGAQTDLASQGRKIHADNSGAVVSVAGSLTIDFGMGQQEMPIALLGTVVDASGLILTSMTSINPIGDGEVTMEPQPGMELQLTAKVGDLWIDLQGGRRISLETVLLDPLHDIALLRPKAEEDRSELGTRAVKATPSAELPGLLTPVVVLGRTDEASNRVPTARIDHVNARIETPRECILLPAEVGAPVFLADGTLVGVVTTLASGEELDPMQMMMGGIGGAGATVVNPWSVVKPIIDQAKQRGADSKETPEEG